MALETELKKLTTAVEALNATIQRVNGGAPAQTVAPEAPVCAAPAVTVDIPVAAVGAAAPAVDIPALAAVAPTANQTAPAPTANQTAPAAGTIGKKEVIDAAIAVGKKTNCDVLRAVLAKFGASNVSGIKPEQYGEAYAAFQAALA